MFTKLLSSIQKFLSRLHQFWNLSFWERSYCLQAFGSLGMVTLSLRALGLRRTQLLLERKILVGAGVRSPGQSREVMSEESLKRLRRLYLWHSVAIRYSPLRVNCLERSLALWWLLRRHGISAALRIGVAKESGQFKAHAWVEWQQQVLNDQTNIDQRFTSFQEPILPPNELL